MPSAVVTGKTAVRVYAPAASLVVVVLITAIPAASVIFNVTETGMMLPKDPVLPVTVIGTPTGPAVGLSDAVDPGTVTWEPVPNDVVELTGVDGPIV